MARKKRKYFKPHLIGDYPHQVVHMSIPAGTDHRSQEFIEARRWQHNLARKISREY